MTTQFRLVGPYPFEEDAIVACGREALSSVADAVRNDDAQALVPDPGRRAGLYVLIAGDQDATPKQVKIAGFWVILSTSWMSKGPAGPPDREPPVAKHLLDAATEEVWWENLPVYSRTRGVWNPVVVLEWPPPIAWRSDVSPPGMPDGLQDDSGPEQDEPEAWLSGVKRERRERVANRPTVVDPRAERYAHLPSDRALVAVIRGSFRKTRALHTGSFQLLHPAVFGSGVQVIPPEQWLEIALTAKAAPADADPAAVAPLGLFSGTVAFPLGGWLTRTLGLWPPDYGEVRLGALTDREVQVKWRQQAWTAVRSTVVVLLTVIGFTVAIQRAAQPQPRPLAAAPPPAAQPAMSVCSADHQKFVEEFRCQIAHLAYGGGVEQAACGDQEFDAIPAAHPEDLRVEFCGLRDRLNDEWTASIGGSGTYSFAQVAGAQACFNVLGYPYPYEHKPAGKGRTMGDPVKFLDDEALRIQPLVDLIGRLDTLCESNRESLEARIQGAIFATHIGRSGGESGDARAREAGDLRTLALSTALVGMGKETLKKCFGVGMQEGLTIPDYDDVCLTAPEARAKASREETRMAEGGEEATDIWTQLDGAEHVGPRSSSIDRYARARFGELDESTQLSLPASWQCHLQLDGQGITGRKPTLGEWDIPIPMPARYRTSGAGVTSQLALDATLIALKNGKASTDQCWRVVSGRLASYAPAHPLLEPLEEGGWPSREQQLCGQICAAAYRVSRHEGPTPWVTQTADLSACMSGQPPPSRPEDLTSLDKGLGTLDRLRMPWNLAGRRGWVDPKPSHVCAFNMIAQGRMPAESSYVVNDFSPQQWAGDLATPYGIAGGVDGLSTKAVVGMSRFGTGSAWSVGSCGHVALQCFTGVMVETFENNKERYEWLGAWQRKVSEISRDSGRTVAQENPWCAPIQEYLGADAEVGAQFNAPCRLGVEEARKRAEYAIRTLASEG